MKLTKEEAERIVWQEHKDWKIITSIEDSSVYKDMYTRNAVFLHTPSGKHYMFYWTATTSDWGCTPYEYTPPDECNIFEVEKEIISVEKWVPVKRS